MTCNILDKSVTEKMLFISTMKEDVFQEKNLSGKFSRPTPAQQPKSA